MMQYPLTPMQQGMLFQSINEPKAGFYIQQSICTLRERVDVASLQRAWRKVVERHAVLRTSFHWEGLTEPAQEVHSSVEFEFEIRDLHDLDSETQQQRLNEYLQTDRQRGFDLTKAPLIRIGLFQLADSWQMVWTSHHCLVDGRSRFLVLRELFEIYDAARRSEQVELQDLRPFSDYIAWLQNSEHADSESFWRQRLSGFVAPTSLPANKVAPTLGERYGFQAIRISESLTSALKSLAEHSEVTLNNLVQGSWALLLNRYTGEEDVVFGTTRACRHSTIEGADSMVGMFINVVPFRVRVDPQIRLVEWLKELRLQHVSLRPYERTSLMKIQQWSDVPSGTPLFETLLTFENYQITRKFQILGEQWTKREEKLIGQSNYPLVLLAEYGGRDLSLKLQYEQARFDDQSVDRMLTRLKLLLEAMGTDPHQQIGKIEMLSEIEKAEQKTKKNKHRVSRLRNLMSARRHAVNLSETRGVRTEYLPDKPLPLVFQPDMDDVDVADWAEGNRDLINKELLQHGALLFRGFDLASPAEFEKFAEAISPNLFTEYGDLPREGVGGKVYGSTPYPSDQAILFHNESSHMHRWPMRIWFFCVQAAQQGGETPIVDCRRVYQLLDPKLRDRFAEKKLMYVRNYIDGLDVSWQTFFRTTDRSVVEEHCRRNSIDFEWNGGRLRTRQICPAVVKHPQTDEMVFFNQLQLHHFSCLEPAVRQSLLSIVKEEDLPRNVYYGDGSQIEDSVIHETREIYDQVAVSFPWQKGDVLMLNNMLVAHGRNPYAGARKIVVAMGEMVSQDELK